MECAVYPLRRISPNHLPRAPFLHPFISSPALAGVTLKRVAQEFSLLELIRVLLRKKEIVRQFPHMYKTFSISSWDTVQFTDAMMHPKAREEAMEFGDKYLPGLAKSLVHERNEFMVKLLRPLSGSIVGVVGALHLQGMHKLWKEAEIQLQ